MDTFLFTLQTTNGIIIIGTLFSSPYRQQTELYFYGHFSLHHMENKWNYIYMDTFSSPYRQQTELYFYGHFSLHHMDNKWNYISMGTFLFTIWTTNGIIYIYMDTFLFTLQTTNGIIFMWTLFSSPYRLQTEFYLYGHFSLPLIDNKRNYISMGIFLFTIWATNGIILIWTLFSSPNRQMK